MELVKSYCYQVLMRLRWLKLIADQIWVKKKVPSDWTKQITVPIFKKSSRLECDNFRGISLLCSAYKVFARAMLNRMKHYVEKQQSESQCGFRAKRGCCDQLFSTKILTQRAKEFNVPVFYASLISVKRTTQLTETYFGLCYVMSTTFLKSS